jgi:hypothetical protein
VRCLLACHEQDSVLHQAIGKDRKGVISVVGYALGIPLACWLPAVAILLYFSVAIMWLVPDRRIERKLVG